jgi:hypothetical protein
MRATVVATFYDNDAATIFNHASTKKGLTMKECRHACQYYSDQPPRTLHEERPRKFLSLFLPSFRGASLYEKGSGTSPRGFFHQGATRLCNQTTMLTGLRDVVGPVVLGSTNVSANNLAFTITECCVC